MPSDDIADPMVHVMVPVPEEHLLEFRQALLRIALAGASWDEDPVSRVLAELDDRARAVLESVARVSVDELSVPYRQVAREVGIDLGELLEVVTGLNDRFRRADLPLPLITDISSREEDDGTVTSEPTLAMVSTAASSVLDLLPAAGGSTATGGR